MSTEVIVVGAGPVGLFAAFQLGIFGFTSRVIDALDGPGGQCIEYYADKTIYDIPACKAITGQELVDRLMEQLEPFDPKFSFGTVARSLVDTGRGTYRVGLSDQSELESSAIIIAGGWGIIGKRGGGENPVASWDVGMSDNIVPVDTERFGSALPGVHVIGDMCFYLGKLRLILSGFHEAALAVQSIRKCINTQDVSSPREPGKKRGGRPRSLLSP
ncbi:MAG: NAD(P)-binding protein [Rhizobiaceae bacterium]|nr:NAD(P)-binding protein [Rhizobiaceae bacterium]